MDDKWKRAFYKWSKTEEFREKVNRAVRRLERVKECDRPAVLFSGGKDSTVGVHLSKRVLGKILVFHYDYKFNIPRWVYREVMGNLRSMVDNNEVVVYTEKYNVPDDRGFFSSVGKFVKEYGVDCIISCLRSEESKYRKVLTKRNRFMGVLNVHVIRDWTWRDVWAYIVRNKLPYVSVYDKYAELVGWDKARFTAFFSQDLEYLGKPNVDKFLMWRDAEVLR